MALIESGSPITLGLPALALFAGLVAGIAGATIGGGFSLIAVPLIMLLLGFPLHLAVGTNLVQVAVTATASVVNHRRKGHVKFRLAVPLLLGGLVGAPLGATASTHIGETALAWTLGATLSMVAAYMAFQALRPKRRDTGGFDLAETLGEERLDSVDRVSRTLLGHRVARLLMLALTTPIEGTFRGQSYRIDRVTPVVMGAGVGFIAGLLGVGGGFLLTPLMTTVLMIPSHLAVGTALVVVTGNAFMGGLTHLFHGNVSLMAAGFLAMGGIVGATVGSQLSEHLSEQTLQRVFIVVLVVVAWRVSPISFF